jgi:hypothetical protein
MVLAGTLAAGPLSAQPARTIPQWTLSAAPELDIGDDRDVRTQFDGVTAVVRMPRGEIAVASSRSQELRLFSADGRYLTTLASSGQLRDLGRVWRSGDTLYAAEDLPEESSLHLYSTSGFIARRQVGSRNAGGIRPLDRFQDGRLVVTAPRRSSGTTRVVDAIFRDSVRLGIMSLDDRANPEWIGTIVNDMYIFRGVGGRGRAVASAPYPWGRATRVAVSGDRLWVGDTETGSITQYDSEGRKVGGFTVPIAPRPIDTAFIRRLRSTALSDAMNWNDRARIDAAYSFPIPGLAPRFAQLLAGAEGEMWVEVFQEDPSAQRRFIVLGRDGRTLGGVTMPPTVVPFEIGRDYVLGVRRDEEGLEHVVRYQLRRR